MSIRSLCTQRIQIARKNKATKTSNGFRTVTYSEVSGMEDVPAIIQTTRVPVNFKIEGEDTRSSDTLLCVRMLDDGTEVDIKVDDRILDKESGQVFHIINLKPVHRGESRFYHAYLIEEGEWLTSNLTG